MTIRVAMIGCGAVGAIHAAQLVKLPDVELTAVFGPDPEKTRRFAGEYGFRIVAASLEDAISAADAVIVCSPSSVHFEQAQASLHAGRHTLVELPPCGELNEAEELGRIAHAQNVQLGCAHTSRYLAPYACIDEALRSGLLGELQEISYIRHPQLRTRSWTDDALLHHAAHAVDLAMNWCGGLEPLACTTFPAGSSAQSVSFIASLRNGKALTATISYAGKLPVSRMVVVGTKHTIETDGFSYLNSDLEGLHFAGCESAVYEQAIAAQDRHFLEACCGKSSYISWTETEDLIQLLGRLQALARANTISQD